MADKANTEGTTTVEEALDPSRALVPAVVRMNETRVARGFWPKLARTAAKIPFAREVVSVWYCARDPATPTAAKGMMLAALAYFVLPTDAIPDVLAGVGFTDDAAVIAGIMALLQANLKDRHRQAAQTALDRLNADD
ncbi:MAG TPA: YkvA family protein [Brevundimonas sp.]|uniref:YkvA family protein n=1 Tax=Brevundimonas sp. TaxID=1871086 RepID=UPI002D035630|nr:YkvA family protein [Brevundimonas sp.]HRH20666.1 YkvA family protein [Brevundimonas sp.]